MRQKCRRDAGSSVPREQGHVKGGIQGQRLVDQRLGPVRAVLVQIQEGQVGIGHRIHGLQGDGAPEGRFGLSGGAARGLHQTGLVPQGSDAGRIGRGTFQIRQGRVKAPFEPGQVNRPRFQGVRVVGVDGQRPRNRRLRLRAIIHQHGKLRTRGGKARLVGKARLGRRQVGDGGWNVQQHGLCIGTVSAVRSPSTVRAKSVPQRLTLPAPRQWPLSRKSA